KMKNQQVLLEVKELKKYFPIKSSILKRTIGNVKAVHNISLKVKGGETLGIVGESGSGKSTFGKTILGLEKATDGSIIYNGASMEKLPDRHSKKYKRDMQMISQDPFASLNQRQREGNAQEK